MSSTICSVNLKEDYFNLEIMIKWKYCFALLEPFRRNSTNNDDTSLTNISKLINQTQAETADDIFCSDCSTTWPLDYFATLTLVTDFHSVTTVTKSTSPNSV